MAKKKTEDLQENIETNGKTEPEVVTPEVYDEWLWNTVQGNIVLHPLDKEISQSYIEYAMSVIVSRALPDTRDGFKPVLRRILFAMNDMKMFYNTKHKKSARIVWEVLWKYHPHWDSSVYMAMVRMAQPWSLRYPLIDWQGNFWSIDWDSPAAMRYTEARLTKVAEEMMYDIDQDTVDRRDNFDWSLKEPVMLPTKFPNHLCNWTMWIAVWMATNMAPHNLTEVIDACLLIMEKEWKKISEEELAKQKDKILIFVEWTILAHSSSVWLTRDEIVNQVKNQWTSDEDKNPDIKNYASYIAIWNAVEKVKEFETKWFEIIYLTSRTKESEVTNIQNALDTNWFPKWKLESRKSWEKYNQVIERIKPNVLVEDDCESWVSEIVIANINPDLKSSIKYIQVKEFAWIDAISSDIEINHPTTYSVSIDEIMEIIKWPDFPTWWTIFDSANIKEVYKKWRWGIVMRWKTHVEETKNGQILVVDEIPYLINKWTLVWKIGELVVDKKIEWVTDIRDESNKDKIRISIYIKNWVNPNKILIQLLKLTELQSNFNINNVTLVEKATQPRTLNIKDLLVEFIAFRRSTVYRRSVFQLNKAKDRLHILLWLKKAIDIIDEVIATIRHSETKQEAKNRLMEKFEFSDPQSEYILQMRLQSLVWLEIQKIIDEINEKEKLIEYLTEIINNPEKLDWVIREEMVYIKEKYWDKRKTQLSEDTSVYNLSGSLKELRDEADKLEEDAIILIENNYNIKVLYQTRIQVIPEETLDLIYTNNQDKLIVITDIWELVVQRLKDFGSFTSASASLNLKKHFNLAWKIIFANTLHYHYENLILLTNHNSIKKIDKELVLSFKKFPTKIINLEEKEKIVAVEATKAWDHVWILTENGQMLIFKQDDFRSMWKTAWWVKAIELLDSKDKTVNMFLHKDEPFILVYSDKKWKLLSLEDLRIRKRAKKWQIVVTGTEKIKWWISIVEWSIRIRFEDGQLQTLHSNDVYLDEPETPMKEMKKMIDKKIEIVYRPWEEKDENFRMKKEKKLKEKELFSEQESKVESGEEVIENTGEKSD